MSGRRVVALFLAGLGSTWSPSARAIPYICVGAPNGGTPAGGHFEYLGPSEYPSDSLARYVCENQSRMGSYPKVFGNGIPEGAGHGTYLLNGMALCEYSYSEDRGSYMVCGNGTPGGTTAGGGGGTGSGDAEIWSAARAVLNNAGRFPGIYQLQRGQAWGAELQRAAWKAEDKVSKLEEIFDDLRATVSAYGQEVVKPSVAQSLGSLDALEGKVASWESRLGALPAAAPGASAPDLEAVVAEAEQAALLESESEQSTEWLDKLDYSAAHDSAGFADGVSRLRDLLHSDAATVLGESERRKLEASYSRYVDDQGFVRDAYLSHPARSMRAALAPGVKTPSGTAHGDRVREAMNRSLLALQPGLEEERRDAAHGALALSLGADEAYQGGSIADGARLSKLALESADFALGLVPVVSSVNDFAQMAHGIATGLDFAGNRMTAADYAFRSAAIVLGVLPAGGAVAKAVRLGGDKITEAFIRGAGIVRSTGLGRALSAAVATSGEGLARITEAVGDVFSYASMATRHEDLARFVDRIPKVRIAGVESAEEANRFYLEVHNYDFAPYRADGFTTRVLVRENSEFSLYRVRSETGRLEGEWLVAFDPRTSGLTKEQFRSFYSIGPENQMSHVSRLVPHPGTELRLGTAARIDAWGGAGGGIQWDIMGRPHKDVGTWEDLGPWQ